MKDKTTKSKNVKTNPGPQKTKIQLEKKYLDLKIQASKLQVEILETERDLFKLNNASKKGGLFDDCAFKDYPPEE